jgi:hypothetical protein
MLAYPPVPVSAKAITPTIPNAENKPGEGSEQQGEQIPFPCPRPNPSECIKYHKHGVKCKEEIVEYLVQHEGIEIRDVPAFSIFDELKNSKMKKYILLFSFLLVITITNGQIPNASFENWTGGDPDQWFTSNIPGNAFVTQVTNAHAGNSAAQCNVLNFFGTPFSAPFALGQNAQGVHTSTAPLAIHGWYIMNSVGGDYDLASILMRQGNNITGGGILKLTNTIVYKEFIMNVLYDSGTPNGDSLFIAFDILNDSSSSPLHIGSYAILDDLSFGPLSGIGDVNNGTYVGLESVSPNPCGDVTQIIYDIRKSGNTILCIYDMNGKMVQQLVNENQSPGRYKAFATLSDLSPGAYITRLTTGDLTDVKKLVVER